MAYSDEVLAHSRQPHNVGSWDAARPDVGTAWVGSPDSGAVVKLQIQVDAHAVITAACFKAYGDTCTIAAASLATQTLGGQSLAQAAQFSSDSLVQTLALPPERVYGALLVQDAVHQAVAHYQQRQSAASAA